MKSEQGHEGTERQKLLDAETRGMEKEKLKICKQMLEEGQSIEKLIRWTRLGQAQINQLQQS